MQKAENPRFSENLKKNLGGFIEMVGYFKANIKKYFLKNGRTNNEQWKKRGATLWNDTDG